MRFYGWYKLSNSQTSMERVSNGKRLLFFKVDTITQNIEVLSEWVVGYSTHPPSLVYSVAWHDRVCARTGLLPWGLNYILLFRLQDHFITH